MGFKFETTPLKNPKTKKEWCFSPNAGSNPIFLHHFSRFGMLGFKELDLLMPLYRSHIYRTIQLAKADNAQFIQMIPHQARQKRRLWNTDHFYQLANEGERFNSNHGVPDYEPPAGSDFEHRAMSVRWAVSLYAGAAADPTTRQIEWPEIKERLTPTAVPSVSLEDRQIRLDWPPTGFARGEHYRFTRGPEIDCFTESHVIIKKKITTHARVIEERLYETQLGLPNDFIPFVVVSEMRKRGILQDIADLIADGSIRKKHASAFGVAVFPAFGSKEPLDTRAYTMPYERIGYPPFHFNA